MKVYLMIYFILQANELLDELYEPDHYSKTEKNYLGPLEPKLTETSSKIIFNYSYFTNHLNFR